MQLVAPEILADGKGMSLAASGAGLALGGFVWLLGGWSHRFWLVLLTTLLLGEHGPGRHSPTVRVPPEARNGRVVAFRISFPTVASYVAGHRAAEGSVAVNDASTGTIRFARWGGTRRFVVNNSADNHQ